MSSSMIISVDDHIVEPPDTFAGRVPARWAERAPRVVQTESGFDTWLYDGGTKTWTQAAPTTVTPTRHLVTK